MKTQNDTIESPTTVLTPKIYGWSKPEEVAEEIWTSIHSILLRGELLFAYKDNNFQIVVVKNNEIDYGVGIMIINSYTMLVPHCPKVYMKDIHNDLVNQKIDKKIIQEFKLLFGI